MNILMITFNPTERGTYFRAFQFARQMVLENNSVTLMSTAHSRRKGILTWHENGVKVVEFPALFRGPVRSGWDPYNTLMRLHWLNRKAFDVVHAFESRPSVIYPALKVFRQGSLFASDWCDWFGKGGSVEERPNPVLRMLLRPMETYYENHFRLQANIVTVICTTLQKRALELGVKKEKIVLVQNGFNMPECQPIKETNVRESFGLSDDAFVIGYIGSLFPKDARLLSKAFFHVQEQLPHARLLHLGQSNYQPVDRSDFKEKIIITGSIDEHRLQMGLSACDVCWLPLSDIPANWGRLPLKFSSYVSAGRPVIVTEVGDLPEIVRKYQVGLTCSPDAVSLSAQTIRIAKNIDKKINYSIAARTLSNNPSYSWRKQALNLLEIYHQRF